VLEALDYDPTIDCSHIGVSVRDRIVTLSGHVASNGEKSAAAVVAGRVKGVRAVIDDLLLELPGRVQTADEALAERCYAQLADNSSVPSDRIHLSVCEGIVTLRGNVDHGFQRDLAATCIGKASGVRGLANELTVKPPVHADAVRRKVREILTPISAINASRIDVETQGSHVTLRGRVNSWHERGLAESAVWSVPGVTGLDDLIVVDA
jgi:osmotically-inducible protein OsmY